MVDRPNKNAVTAAVDEYRDAMRAFVIRQLKQVKGRSVPEHISESLFPRRVPKFEESLQKGHTVEDFIDTTDFPEIIKRKFEPAFSRFFDGDRTIQDLGYLIHNIARNEEAHPKSTDIDDTEALTALLNIEKALKLIKAPKAFERVEAIRTNLFSSDAPPTPPPPSPPNQSTEERKKGESAAKSGEAEPLFETNGQRKPGDLTPWREVIDINPDVLEKSMQSEFMADLYQVHSRKADEAYSDPVQFYKRTYISDGLRSLLVNALKRFHEKGGDPVVQTKIGFGGGKTHSLIALRHLAKRPDQLFRYADSGNPALARMTRELQGVVQEAGLNPNDIPGKAKVAVLAGTHHSAASQEKTKENGDPLNTLWGVMAYQLAGQRGYDAVKPAIDQNIAPSGEELDKLFNLTGPFVILMDEIVSYTQNLSGKDEESRIYPFIQNLSEAVRRTKCGMLVVTLPSSDDEAGGDEGKNILARIETRLERVQAVSQPLEIKESFEVIRRRLFEEVKDKSKRDETCEAFARLYNRGNNFPEECKTTKNNQAYLERMKSCYPIHPEVFDRLYEDWSAYVGFQRTRGVLKMMAACIHRLQKSDDPLIMPGDIPLDDPNIRGTFEPLLEKHWDPVFSEINGETEQIPSIDALKRYQNVGGAAQRIARTVFLGSASANKRPGIDLRRIHLGTVKPGDGIAAYGEALGRMKEELYFLYAEAGMHYFFVDPNLVKVARDRVANLDDAQIDALIVKKLNAAASGQNAAVARPGEITEDTLDGTLLVILSPEHALPSRSGETNEAEKAALNILDYCGKDKPRIHKNMIVFLAAKTDSIRALRRDAAQTIAWESIVRGNAAAPKVENLEGSRLKDAKARLQEHAKNVDKNLVSAYQHVLSPRQPEPREPKYELDIFKVEAKQNIVEDAFQKLVEQDALADEISVSAFTRVSDEYIWGKEQNPDHINIEKLWALFASHGYFPRLRGKDVLVSVLMKAVEEGLLGYAKSYDAEEDKYEGLQYEASPPTGQMGEMQGLIVKKETAELHAEVERDKKDEERERDEERRRELEKDSQSEPTTRMRVTAAPSPKNLQQTIRYLEDEIMPNLRNGDLKIEIIVTAIHRDGFTESEVRNVTENANALKFNFEKNTGE